MKLKGNMRTKSLLLCMMLMVAMVMTVVGCGKQEDVQLGAEEVTMEELADATTQAEETTEEETTETETTEEVQAEVVGEGQTTFMFTVVDMDGNESNFEVHTDKATVGEALLELGLIAGDDGEYGLYVKTVNGITADYDVDKTYWAFYVDGEYAQTGVDSTAVEDGKTYAFKVEK